MNDACVPTDRSCYHVTMKPSYLRQIRKWMEANIRYHIDPKTGEADCTSLVEVWDNECADGGQTLDPSHPAWDIAIDVAMSRSGYPMRVKALADRASKPR